MNEHHQRLLSRRLLTVTYYIANIMTESHLHCIILTAIFVYTFTKLYDRRIPTG